MATVSNVLSPLWLRVPANLRKFLPRDRTRLRTAGGSVRTLSEVSCRTPHRSCTNCKTSDPFLVLSTWDVPTFKLASGPPLRTPRNASSIFMRRCSLIGSAQLLKNRIHSATGLAAQPLSGCTDVNGSRGSLLNCRDCSGCSIGAGRRYGSQASNQDELSLSHPSLGAYVAHLVEEHQWIAGELADEQNAADGKKQKRLRRRLAELAPLAEKMEEWDDLRTELTEIEELTADEELKEMALLEKQECLVARDSLEGEILRLLAPADEADDNDIIVEFSAGVGGQEAMLFTADIFEMYEGFAAYKGWEFQQLEYFTTELGGLRHASVSVRGGGAYKLMKLEGGVHRVQRVPKTEKSGRVHTSTMTVAVLPQPKEIDLKLDPKDLRVETKKASGAGGQHVQTTDSAVRITHVPTGATAESQQERSQIKNRAIALTLLQAKIYGRLLAERQSSERSLRRSQVGDAGRSDKIRTYNVQQDRVTDHRLGQSVFGVDGFLAGGQSLDEMMTDLTEEEERGSVLRIVEDFVESTKSK